MGLINPDVFARLMQQKKTTTPVTVPKTTAMPTTPNTGAIGAVAGVTLPKSTPSVTTPTSSGVTIPNGYSATNYGGSTTAGTSSNGGVTVPRIEQALTNQSNLVNTPFSYDPNTDASTQAAIRNANNQLDVLQKNTYANLRATGRGKSSYSDIVAHQQAGQTAETIANTIIPQYEAQAYNRYQDQIGNQRNLYSDLYQQDVTTPINESSVTGVYQNAATKDALNKIMLYKAEAEGPNITAARRAELTKLADQQRAIVDANGGDSSRLGASVNSRNVNQTGIGARTLAGKAQDQSIKNANLDAATTVANTTGRAVTPQSDWQGLYRQAADPNTPLTVDQQNMQFNQQFDQAKFDEDSRRYGLDYALQQQQNQISEQNANTSRMGTASSIDNSNFNQLLDVWQATGAAPAGLEGYGVAQGTQYTSSAAAKAAAPPVFEDFQSNIEKIVQRDDKTKAVTNPQTVEDYILNSNLSPYEMYRAYGVYGLKWGGEVPTKGE